MAQIAPYGTWKSPISADDISKSGVRLGEIALDGESVFWSESRPIENGRSVIVRRDPDGTLTDILPAPFNARTCVHEYGGGAYTVVDGVLFFTNYADQRVYRLAPGTDPVALTNEDRYADFAFDRMHNRLLAVQESHDPALPEAANAIGAIPTDPEDASPPQVLIEGSDFYASPRVSPDGTRLAWLSWNHPNMPWDGCELWSGTISEEGDITDRTLIAGGIDESIFQPEWSPDGILHFVSDRSGWWNLYRLEGDNQIPLYPVDREFGMPLWVFGMSTYGFSDSDNIVCISTYNATWELGILHIPSRKYEIIDLPSTRLSNIKVSGTSAVFHAASPVEEDAIVRFDLAARGVEILRRSSEKEMNREDISVPGAVTYVSGDGAESFAFFYPPQNADFIAPEGELPPVIVLSHGGPTGSTDTGLDPKLQFWTSRGFAILDVNYGGSTSYGRAYRERLDDKWGIVDVDDCVYGVQHLIREGLVDGNRTIIRGGSASGFTTLYTLASRDDFAAGSSHYGIGDLGAMVRDTHKFESRYFDRLVGPYPERMDIYQERSPINHVASLSCPLIIFQGDEDEVVPPNQATAMFEAVRSKGIPVAMQIFEGEQHGFRKAENIRQVLENELYFFGKVFGFEPYGEPDAIEIVNLSASN